MKHPVSLALLLVVAGTTAAFLVSPFLLAPGTARELDGAANAIEHRAQWRTYPPVAAFAYGMGDLLCHQRADRSWAWAGNQLPVDVRLLAMFLFGTAGAAAATGATCHARVRPILDDLTRGWWRDRSLAWAWLLALAPVAIDGSVQLLTPYESHAVTRFVTGASTGLAGAFLVGIGLDALARPLPPAPIHRPLAPEATTGPTSRMTDRP